MPDRSPLILVVDDEPDARELLCLFLQGEGFRTVEADDGRDALERLADGLAPDLIVLDLNMPRLNGWDTYAALRDSFAAIPVVVWTATTLQAESTRGLDGAVLLHKTAPPIDLATSIRRALAAAPSPAPA